MCIVLMERCLTHLFSKMKFVANETLGVKDKPIANITQTKKRRICLSADPISQRNTRSNISTKLDTENILVNLNEIVDTSQ